MARFLTFMESVSKTHYAVSFDPKVTTRQLLVNRVEELDNTAVVDNKMSSEGIFWVATVLPKSDLSNMTGVQYVVESNPEIGIKLKPEPKKETV
jgi:hypothetical protein